MKRQNAHWFVERIARCLRAAGALIVVVPLLTVTPALAGNDVFKAFDGCWGHLRVASSYLRTGNRDLGALELEGLIDCWQELETSVATSKDEATRAFLNETGTTARALLEDIDAGGDLTKARKALEEVRGHRYALAQKLGVYGLSECIFEANTLMDTLAGYRSNMPEFTEADERARVGGEFLAYGEKIEACHALATSEIQKNPEYQRLYQGIRENMDFFRTFGENGNQNLFFRLFVELRSFDRLFYFQFG